MRYKKGLISVSVVTWNSKGFIEKCLQALLRQKKVETEIIVVDNCSTDGTIELIQEYSASIKVVQNSENLGYSGGHNKGIENSSGEFILLINPDVYLCETYCYELVSFLEDKTEYGGAIGKIYQTSSDIEQLASGSSSVIDTTGLTILRSRQFIARGYGKTDDHLLSSPTEIFGVDGMAPLYRREMLENIKISEEYFDELFFAYCEDQDLSWRARLLGWKFCFVPDAKAYHVRSWKPNALKERKHIRPEIRRMALRNHYLMVIKNDDPVSLLRHCLFIGFRALKIFTYILLFEQSTLYVLKDIYHSLPVILRKRREINQKRKVSRQTIEQWFGK
jgi:GT2 family glycosyltransferase